MKILITGGAGFIGNNLVHVLLKKKHNVVVFDNLSIGTTKFLPLNSEQSKFIKGDVLDYKNLAKSMKGIDMVYHLSANSDVRKGSENLSLDINQGILATHNVLEAMRENNVKKIFFPSSMTVYGQALKSPTKEDYGPNMPISLYAAGKLGAEGLICAYSYMFGFDSWIFRFANVIGPKMTHGVIFDLVNKLSKNKKSLDVLGNGMQTKPYIHMEDIINAILFVQEKTKKGTSIFNVGVTDAISVKEIVSIIVKKMNLQKTKINYEKTEFGWKGDVTNFRLDTSKLTKLGFKPKYSSIKAVEKTVDEILAEIDYKND
jgi:UDP-glucose 4-epimerase